MFSRKKFFQKGFTLTELLIVVAIISCLVAISFPLLLRSKKAAQASADAAFVRSAKSAACAEYLLSCTPDASVTYYFDAGPGTVTRSPQGLKGYGNSSADLPVSNLTDDGASGIPKGNLVAVSIDQTGAITASWVSPSDSGTDFDAPIALQPEKWANKNTGNTFPPGLLIQDETGVYVFCDNNDWYGGHWKNQSLKDLLTQYPGRIRRLSRDTIISSAEDFHRGDTVEKGTLIKLSDQHYLIRCTSGRISDEPPSANSDNWVSVFGH